MKKEKQRRSFLTVFVDCVNRTASQKYGNIIFYATVLSFLFYFLTKSALPFFSLVFYYLSFLLSFYYIIGFSLLEDAVRQHKLLQKVGKHLNIIINEGERR